MVTEGEWWGRRARGAIQLSALLLSSPTRLPPPPPPPPPLGTEGTTNLITKCLESVGKKIETVPDPTQVRAHRAGWEVGGGSQEGGLGLRRNPTGEGWDLGLHAVGRCVAGLWARRRGVAHMRRQQAVLRL